MFGNIIRQMAEINGYILSRNWFNFACENHGTVKPVHAALWFWIVEVWNTLAHPKEFGLPAKEAMHHIGVGRHEAFSGALKDLTEWGFIVIKQPSINQYKANIISICPPKNAQGTAKGKRKSNVQGTAKGTVDNTAIGNVNVIEPLNLRTLELLNLINKEHYILLLNERCFSENLNTGLLDYFQDRTNKKTPFSGLAVKKLFNKVALWLKKYSDFEILESINNTITSSKWTDIYEPKPSASIQTKSKISQTVTAGNNALEILRRKENEY